MFAALLCLVSAGCRKAAQRPFQSEKTYAEIEREFISGDLLLAQRNAEDALRREADPRWSTAFRVELARILLYRGQSADVVKMLQPSLPGSSSDDALVRRSLFLAIAQVRTGNAAAANQTLAAAEALHPAGDLHAEMVGARGTVAMYQGRLDEAETCFEASLLEAQQRHLPFLAMQMWMNRGSIAIDLEHYEDAVVYLHEASTIAQSIGAKLALEKALSSLNSTYYHTGDFARTQQTAPAAEAQARSLGATLDEVQILLNVGMSQVQTNDLEGARASFERSLGLAEKLENPEKILFGHTALSYLLLRQHSDAAAGHIEEAVRIAQLTHDPTQQVEPALLQCLLLLQQNKDTAAEGQLLQLVRNSNNSPSIQWAAESTLAGIYAKDHQSQRADLWFKRAIVTFHQQRLSLKSVELELPFLENGSTLYLGYMEHLIQTHRMEEALQVLDQSRAETLAEGLGVSSGRAVAPPSARTLAARLHATILVYCLRPDASYLWASNASKQQFFTLPGSATLLPLIARHTEAILASKDLLAQSDAPGRTLYDALIEPAKAFLPTGGRVFLIGDKELSGLNFETLISSRDGTPHYWIEEARITNARSLRLLAASQATPAARTVQAMLLIGDPVYRADEFTALPNAAVEMTRVASHFAVDRRAVVSGARAAPPVYATSEPGRYAFIHFVAHATASETNPLDSAIILSGDPESSRLYARDILKEPLKADLVTLSSCYGSGVRNYSGEGVVGLVWAFLRAGAHSVIGAMWEVSDVSTPQLMDTLYAELLAGESPDAALRTAKLSLLHSGGVFRKPLYWASFQLYAGR